MTSLIQGFVESLGQDYATDKWNGYAEARFQPTKDPFYEKMPNGKKKRRKLPDFCSQKEKKAWKKLQNRAWKDDRCLCGCLWVNWGLGLAPLLSIIPTIGPIIMYWVHSKLISMADKELALPPEMLAKMHGNIVLDLLISLPPLLGTLLAWMNACSTRNCAMIYNHIAKQATKSYNRQAQQSAYKHVQAPQRSAPLAASDLQEKPVMVTDLNNQGQRTPARKPPPAVQTANRGY
ncbi:LANO_0F06480g1_1 [Lachancea nothofagi CBS 11611]|uniref:LANO_0F06480g1_1 n=1 Tax=Lachancea nothofagi CBS 11611 TaxID=1266666 RepID=A0A1G4K8J5_9SACH|nr:LANO_0F06480g1_1 [Lachancea nothofagi CBS 11611]